MHTHPFDELAKALARGMTRREALQRFGVGLASALLVSLSPKAWADPSSTCSSYCLGKYRAVWLQFKFSRCWFSCMDCLQSKGTVCSTASTGAVICCAPGVTCTNGSCVSPKTCPANQATCGTGKCCPATMVHPDDSVQPAYCASSQGGLCVDKCCPQGTLCCAESGAANCYWPAGACCTDSLGGACFENQTLCAIGRSAPDQPTGRYCCSQNPLDVNGNPLNLNDPDAVGASPDCTGGGPGRVSASPSFTV